MAGINFIIIILFIAYFVFTWRSTKDFENILMRVSYIGVGTLFITVLTLILFWISKIGVQYPKDEMIGQVQKIILLVFIPINGFIVLTQFSSVVTQIKSGMVSKDDLQKKIKILIIVFIILIIFEAVYFKHIQLGIIDNIKAKG